MGEIHRISVGADSMDAYVAVPKGWGPYPAVIALQHRWGVDDFMRDRCDRLAGAGYVAVAPEMFHRSPREASLEEKGKHLGDATILEDVTAAHGFLRSRDDIARGNIAVMGWCMGGRMALLSAAVLPDIRACVVFYAGGVFLPRGEFPPTFERLKHVKCPIIGFSGREDVNPSPEQVARMDAELARHEIPHEFHVYEGAGHAFQAFDRPEKYREWAAAQSWNRAMSFLRKTLSVSSGAAV